MFTQEQHQLVAEAIWSIRLKHYPSELPQKTYKNMVEEFASRLERGAPHFDRARFCEICGIDN